MSEMILDGLNSILKKSLDCTFVIIVVFIFEKKFSWLYAGHQIRTFLKSGLAFAAHQNKFLFMKTLLAILLWCILFVLCWPLALAMIFLLPLLWLILLPFKIVGLTLDIIFKLISAVILFPFRIIGAVK